MAASLSSRVVRLLVVCAESGAVSGQKAIDQSTTGALRIPLETTLSMSYIETKNCKTANTIAAIKK